MKALGLCIALCALLAGPALAAETEFMGHLLETSRTGPAREVIRVNGTRYAIPGTRSQVVARAQACLARHDSGAGIVSVDPAAGEVVAVSRVEFRHQSVPRLVRGRLVLAAHEGGFNIVMTQLAVRDSAPADGRDEVFNPVQMRDDAAWQPALSAVIAVEQRLVSCMFG